MAKPIPQWTPRTDAAFTRRRVVRPDGCHQWVGKIDHNGYGVVYLNGEQFAAHRLAYEGTDILDSPTVVGTKCAHESFT